MIPLIILSVGLIAAITIRLIPVFRNKPWLFRKQIQHDIFGRLWFVKNRKNPRDSHYQGYTYFKPANREIDIFFSSDVRFDDNHTSFYKEIEKRYSDIYPGFLRQLEEHFKIRLDDLYLSAIFLANSSNSNQIWQLIYISIKNDLLNITIDLKEWKIQGIKV